MSSPGADAGRIGAFLDELAEIGTDPAGGWSRIAFTPQERRAHAHFARWVEGYGLTTSVDAIGNSYGDLPGQQGYPTIVLGSHLDSVYQGGNFDGAAGVAAAVEAARLLAQRGGTRCPLRVAAFTCEEGARFGVPCVGSRVVTGAFTSENLRAMTDANGISAADAAARAGLRPDDCAGARWDFGSIGAFFEIHIEQGRTLELERRPVGVVTAIGGSTRIRLAFSGHADHSGATPMWMRRDALVAAAEFIEAVDERAREHPTTVATVGQLNVIPNSMTTVPGRAELVLDVRDIDAERQRDLAEILLDDVLRIATAHDVELTGSLLSDQSPVLLDTVVQDVLADSADRLGLPYRFMASGASHDSAHVSRWVPAGMLFVPSSGGVSHCPDEAVDPGDLAVAVDVFVDAFEQLCEAWAPATEGP